MRSPVICRARCALWGSFLALLLIGTVLVSAQTKKPSNKPNQPQSKATPKSAKKPPVIPGLPANVSATVATEMEQKLREPLDERNTRRKHAASEAIAWLKREKTANDAVQSAAALVMAGARQVDALKLAEATQTFQRVTVEHPDSIWAREARLFLFDLALEHDLSLDRADEWLHPMIDWSQSVPKPERRLKPTIYALTVAPSGPTDPLPLQSLGPNLSLGVAELRSGERKGSGAVIEPSLPAARDVQSIAADVRLRSGLLRALRSDVVRAKQEFQQAEALGLDSTTAVAAFANRVLMDQRLAPLPDPVRNGSTNTASLIRLALILEESQQRDRALRLWDAILQPIAAKAATASRGSSQADRSSPTIASTESRETMARAATTNVTATDSTTADVPITHPQRSFAHYRRAMGRDRLLNPLEREPQRIAKDCELAIQFYPDADWADDALWLQANMTRDLLGDTDRAVQLWRRLRDKHPGSEHLHSAAFSIGLAYEFSKRWDEAQDAFQEAQRQFPKSPYNTLIDEHLKKIRSELARPKPRAKR